MPAGKIFRHKPRGTKAIATKALLIAKKTRKMVQGEKKKKAFPFSMIIDDGGVIEYVSGIAQGNNFDDRAGRKVKAISWLARFRLVINQGAVPPPAASAVRFVLFVDKQNNSILPLIGDVLQGPDTLLSPIRTLSLQRYRVLWDRTVVLTAQNNPERYLKVFRKFNIPLFYDGTGVGISSADKNAIFLLMISDEQAGDEPSVEFESRLTYIDN